MILAAGDPQHDAVVSRVAFERAYDFEADSVAVKADQFVQAVGRSRDPDLRGGKRFGPLSGHVSL
jgi:predicted GTPase